MCRHPFTPQHTHTHPIPGLHLPEPNANLSAPHLTRSRKEAARIWIWICNWNQRTGDWMMDWTLLLVGGLGLLLLLPGL